MGLSLPPFLRARAYLPARRECDHAQAVHLCYPGWLATCLPALRPRGVRAVQPPLLVWSHAGGIGLGMYRGGYCLAYLTNAEMKFEAMQRAYTPRHSRFPLTL